MRDERSLHCVYADLTIVVVACGAGNRRRTQQSEADAALKVVDFLAIQIIPDQVICVNCNVCHSAHRFSLRIPLGHDLVQFQPINVIHIEQIVMLPQGKFFYALLVERLLLKSLCRQVSGEFQAGLRLSNTFIENAAEIDLL